VKRPAPRRLFRTGGGPRLRGAGSVRSQVCPVNVPTISLTAAYGSDQRRGGDDITRNARATDIVDLFTLGGWPGLSRFLRRPGMISHHSTNRPRNSAVPQVYAPVLGVNLGSLQAPRLFLTPYRMLVFSMV
jgi:hypothetical protein